MESSSDASLSVTTKAAILVGLIRSLFNRTLRPQTGYEVLVPGNSKFMSAIEAVKLVNDGDFIATSGLGGNASASTSYRALVDRFEETGHPKDCSLIAIGGAGSRGRAKGSIEDLGVEGLVGQFFTAHTETWKNMLKLGDQNRMEIQVIPQGLLAMILGKQAIDGTTHITSRTGVGTFVDPRCGRGTPLCPKDGTQYVEANDDGTLTYRLPPITVAIFSAPAADKNGNIYMKGASMFAESWEIAKAAKRNGGKVIVQVGSLVPEGFSNIFLPAEDVDAIIVHPSTEQTIGAQYVRGPFEFLTLDHTTSSTAKGLATVRFINGILGITPKRSDLDQAAARLGAMVFAQHAFKGMSVDIGTGLPEEIVGVLHNTGILKNLKVIVESGVIGGVPCKGVFFGSSINPDEFVSSAEVFRRIYKRLDAVIVGALEVDSEGNVNVSKRGEGAINYVGPGGFIDLTTCAQLCMFICPFSHKAEIEIITTETNTPQVSVKKPGIPKFVNRVSEITFNGKEALRAGKTVIYITDVGYFRLTQSGIQLEYVMPGIDIMRDIVNVSGGINIIFPGGDMNSVPIVPDSVLTGTNFKLALETGLVLPAKL